MFIAPATLDQCREAVAIAYGGGSTPIAPGAWAAREATKLQDIRDLVAGGEDCRRFLFTLPDEDPWKKEQRDKAFVNVPVTGKIVDQRSFYAYGYPPTRDFEFENEADAELFESVYNYCGGNSLWRNRVAFYTFRDQISWVKSWYQESTKKLRLTPLTLEKVMPIPHPDDPADTILGVVEISGTPTAPRNYLWTLTESGWINDQWQWQDGAQKHPNSFGVIPYTRFGDPFAGHSLADAALRQIMALNLRSWELEGWRAQSFAIFVLEGEMLSEEEASESDGIRRTKVSNTGYVQVQVGSKLYAVKPDFPVDKIRDAEMTMLKETYEDENVSSYGADSSQAAEQPWAMAMRQQRPLANRTQDVMMFEAQEKEAFQNLLAVARTKQLVGASTTGELKLAFPKSIIPIDEKGQEELEGREVTANQRLLETFVGRWVLPGAPDLEVQEYVAKLEAQKAAADATLLNGLNLDTKGNGMPPDSKFPVPPPPQAAASKMADLYGGEVTSGTVNANGGLKATTGGGTAGGGGGGGGRIPIDGGGA